jgi:hypothetical protein
MTTLITDRRETNWAVAAIAIAVTVLTLGYTLPWMIAQLRGKSNTLVVASINVLTGWTFVGWVVALVMSLTPHRPVAALPAGWYSTYSGNRYWDGATWR